MSAVLAVVDVVYQGGFGETGVGAVFVWRTCQIPRVWI